MCRGVYCEPVILRDKRGIIIYDYLHRDTDIRPPSNFTQLGEDQLANESGLILFFVKLFGTVRKEQNREYLVTFYGCIFLITEHMTSCY